MLLAAKLARAARQMTDSAKRWREIKHLQVSPIGRCLKSSRMRSAKRNYGALALIINRRRNGAKYYK